MKTDLLAQPMLFSYLHLQVFIILLFFLGIFSFGIFSYNRLIKLTRKILQAWANINISIKQRHDELKKLINLCAKYLDYEQNLLKNLTRARSPLLNNLSTANISSLNNSENQLQELLQNLSVLIEANPSLKSNSQFIYLQEKITLLEKIITDRRHFFNQCITTYNTRIGSIPDNLIALIFNYHNYPLLNLPSSMKKDVNITKSFINK